MKETVKEILDRYCEKNSIVAKLKEKIYAAAVMICDCYRSGGKLLICGNGGSCADADHIVGELVKGFVKKRPLSVGDKDRFKEYGDSAAVLADRLQYSLPAINLCAQSSLITAVINDIGGNEIFAQQVIGYGKPGDILIGISTSGNSTDIINASYAAKANGLKTIAVSGRDGGKMNEIFDLSIIVPLNITSDIQDCHSVIYHALCEMTEAEFFVE